MDRRKGFVDAVSAGRAGSTVRFLPDLPPQPWQKAKAPPRTMARVAVAPANAQQPDAQPDWFRAAGRAPAMAMGVAAAFGLLMSGLNGGLIQFGIALLGVCAIAWLVRRSWRLAIYGPQSGVRQNAPPVEASVRREADAVTPPNAVLFKAYVRGFFAYLSTLFLLSALAQGIAPQSGMLARASMFLPTLYIAMILLGVLRSAVLVLVKAAQHLNIRRGLADCTIGAILAGLYLAMDVIAATHAGMLPSGKQLMFDLFQMFSGAIGGFEFWRAVGAPGATRRTAMLLGRFKTGLLSGLRRGF